jgi:hypothetical protein
MVLCSYVLNKLFHKNSVWTVSEYTGLYPMVEFSENAEL